MKKMSIICSLLLITFSCWSDENDNYLIKQTPKKSKVTAQQCYEKMLSGMIWSAHNITLLGQNQTNLLLSIDNSTLEKADQKLLQKIAQEQDKYNTLLEQFAQAQKEHRAFHEGIKRELEAKKA